MGRTGREAALRLEALHARACRDPDPEARLEYGLALARAGRARDALHVFQTARELLDARRLLERSPTWESPEPWFSHRTLHDVRPLRADPSVVWEERVPGAHRLVANLVAVMVETSHGALVLDGETGARRLGLPPGPRVLAGPVVVQARPGGLLFFSVHTGAQVGRLRLPGHKWGLAWARGRLVLGCGPAVYAWTYAPGDARPRPLWKQDGETMPAVARAFRDASPVGPGLRIAEGQVWIQVPPGEPQWFSLQGTYAPWYQVLDLDRGTLLDPLGERRPPARFDHGGEEYAVDPPAAGGNPYKVSLETFDPGYEGRGRGGCILFRDPHDQEARRKRLHLVHKETGDSRVLLDSRSEVEVLARLGDSLHLRITPGKGRPRRGERPRLHVTELRGGTHFEVPVAAGARAVPAPDGLVLLEEGTVRYLRGARRALPEPRPG